MTLPVWFGVKEDNVDALSGATPTTETKELKLQIPDKYNGKKIDLFIETNVSFDYNDYYKKDLAAEDPAFSDVNGQPSVVFKGTIDTYKSTIVPMDLNFYGHGDVLGNNSNINTDFDILTTAKDILKDIKVSFNKGN